MHALTICGWLGSIVRERINPSGRLSLSNQEGGIRAPEARARESGGESAETVAAGIGLQRRTVFGCCGEHGARARTSGAGVSACTRNSADLVSAMPSIPDRAGAQSSALLRGENTTMDLVRWGRVW